MTDRVTPVTVPSVFQGPPQAPQTSDELGREAESPQVGAPALLNPVHPLILKERTIIRETIRRSYDGPSDSRNGT
jgi:hypothetical protein